MRAVRDNIEAARDAATPLSGPSPRTTGIVSPSWIARILAGLTNDSDRGRQASACTSSRSAVSKRTDSPASGNGDVHPPRPRAHLGQWRVGGTHGQYRGTTSGGFGRDGQRPGARPESD